MGTRIFNYQAKDGRPAGIVVGPSRGPSSDVPGQSRLEDGRLDSDQTYYGPVTEAPASSV